MLIIHDFSVQLTISFSIPFLANFTTFLLKESWNHMDDRDWVILTTLYDEKNITKTAEKIRISQ